MPTTIDPLLETVEEIRARDYPDLPANLIARILLLHADPSVPQSELARQVEEIVTQEFGEGD